MKTELNPMRPENFYNYSGLHELVDFLFAKFKAAVAQSNCCFVNDIPSHLELVSDKQVLSSILNGLLCVVVTHSRNCKILLSARQQGTMLSISIKQSQGFNSLAIKQEISRLQPLATQVQGVVVATSQRQKLTGITVGLPNLPVNQHTMNSNFLRRAV